MGVCSPARTTTAYQRAVHGPQFIAFLLCHRQRLTSDSCKSPKTAFISVNYVHRVEYRNAISVHNGHTIPLRVK